MKIIWQETNPWPPLCGHGLGFYVGVRPGPESLVAFLDGFDWLHGRSDEAVVLVPREGLGHARIGVAETKRLLAGRIRRDMPLCGRIAGDIHVLANA